MLVPQRCNVYVIAMLHKGNVNNVSDGNVHGVSHLVDEIWCWVSTTANHTLAIWTLYLA